MAQIEDLKIPIGLTKSGIKAQLQEMRAELKGQLDQQVRDTQFASRQQTAASKAAARVRALDEKMVTQTVINESKKAGDAALRSIRQTAEAETRSAADRAAAARRLAQDAAFWAKYSAEEKDKAEETAAAKSRTRSQEISKRVAALRESDKKGIFSQVTNVEALGGAFMKLQVATQIAGAIRTAMHAVADSVNEARLRIKTMVSEMEAARKESKELAALLGKKATAGFTAAQAGEAASVGLDVSDYTEFQKSFQAYTGQYVGKEGATPEELEENHQKLSAEQAARLQKKVATYAMGARGLGADDSARLLGTIVAKSQAGTSDDEIMSQYAKLMKVMELAPGKTSPMLSQLAELGMESAGEGGDFKDLLQSGYLLRTMAQRNPQEGATYGRNLLRGLREIRQDPTKMKELGITKGMDIFHQLESISHAVEKDKKAGGDEGTFLSKYFQDIREWGGEGTIDEGINQGGFARSATEAASVGADTAESEQKKYLRGEEGIAASDRSNLLRAQREAAGYYSPLRHLQNEALTQMVSSRELEMPENAYNAILTGASSFQQGSREEAETRDSSRPESYEPALGIQGRSRISVSKRSGRLRPIDGREGPRRRGPALEATRRRGRETARGKGRSPSQQQTASRRGSETIMWEMLPANVNEVVDSLDAITDSFDFTVPGADQSLGRDVAKRVVQGIYDRSLEERRGARSPWKQNESKYRNGKRKTTEPTNRIAEPARCFPTGALMGRTTIEPDQITMIYGTGDPPARASFGGRPKSNSPKTRNEPISKRVISLTPASQSTRSSDRSTNSTTTSRVTFAS